MLLNDRKIPVGRPRHTRLRLSGWLFAADVGLGLADKRVGMSSLICSLSIRTTMMQR